MNTTAAYLGKLVSAARRPFAAITVIAMFATLSVGCGSGSHDSPSGRGIATTARASKAAGDGATSTTSSARTLAVRFAECMRQNGVSAFPDPDASGALTIDAVANGTGIDTSSSVWKAALSACQRLQPPGFTGTGRTAAQQKAALKFAQCVRQHGVSDFPDPARDAPLIDTDLIPSTQSGDLSALNAATTACGSYARDAGVTPR